MSTDLASPRLSRAAALLAAALVLAAPTAARADAVKIQFQTKVGAGGTPKLRFVAEEAIDDLAVDLQREDGKRVAAKLGAMAAGAARDLPLPGDAGKHHYAGQVTLTQRGQARESRLEFDALVAGALEAQIDRSKVDLPRRRLEARLSRPAGKVSVKVFGAQGGAPLAEDEQDLSAQPAGGPLVVTWPPTGDAQVARIDLRFEDRDGFFTGVSLVPWNVHIPHEEVLFATDSAAIAAAESPKLEASYAKIADALAKHRELGPIKLFIAGHTDTVGNAGYNVKLSQRRAQAIAGWFRKRGLRIPVLFEGFGEHAPLVGTPDEKDEPRNRRVDYILAVEEPALKATAFRASWKRAP